MSLAHRVARAVYWLLEVALDLAMLAALTYALAWLLGSLIEWIAM